MSASNSGALRSGAARPRHRRDSVLGGLAEAYRDAVEGRRLRWASPAVFTVGAYVILYGLGLVIDGPSARFPVMTLAVGLGLAGLLAGVGLGWSSVGGSSRRQPIDARILTRFAFLLLAIGLAALLAYFVAIGYVPLFRPGLEQSRVVAAEEGGGPLRVLSMLALPGIWILVAQAAAIGKRRWLTAVIAGVVAVAVAFALTGNRSPAFTTLETALIIGLLAAGRGRLGMRALTILALVAMLLVVGAGLFGAFRLASRNEVYGPPVPNAPGPDYPALTVVAIKGYLVVPIRNLDYTMDAVPQRIGWQLGRTYLQPLLTVLPGKQTTFDADLKVALNQTYAGGGTVPGLLGEAYANFGPVGWLMVPFFTGAAITALFRLSQTQAPEFTALYGYGIAHVSIGAVLSGLSTASIFPVEAYAVLGFAVLGLPTLQRLLAPRVGKAGT